MTKNKKTKQKAWTGKPLTRETRSWEELDRLAREQGFSLAECIAAMGGPAMGMPNTEEE